MALGKVYKIHPSKGMIIKYKGVIDIDSLYKSVKSWFKDYKYDYFEKENTEKNKPQGNTLLIKMRGEREIDDYAQFKVEVDFNEILRVKKVDKGYTGEARIIIRSNIIFDYKDNWKSVPFLLYLYNNIILKRKILDYYWQNAYDEMMELSALIKSKLGLIK